MDLARGIAIFLVMFSHMHMMGRRGDLMTHSDVADAVDRVAIVMRMPLLMFLSGMLVPRSLDKGWKKFLPGKFTRLAWPFVVWTVIWAAMNWIHDRGQPSDLLMGLIYPAKAEPYLAGTTLWYLWNLFWYYLLAQAMRLLRIPLWVGVAGAMTWLAIITHLDGYGLTEYRFPFLLIFFFMGMATFENWREITEFCRRPLVTVLLVGFAAAPVMLNFDQATEMNPRYSIYFVAGGLAMVYLLIAYLSRVTNETWVRPLLYVGRHSLYFYVSHMCVYVAYIWWIGWRYDLSEWAHAGIMLSLAIILPVLAVELGKVIPPIKWLLFELPFPRK